MDDTSKDEATELAAERATAAKKAATEAATLELDARVASEAGRMLRHAIAGVIDVAALCEAQADARTASALLVRLQHKLSLKQIQLDEQAETIEQQEKALKKLRLRPTEPEEDA